MFCICVIRIAMAISCERKVRREGICDEVCVTVQWRKGLSEQHERKRKNFQGNLRNVFTHKGGKQGDEPTLPANKEHTKGCVKEETRTRASEASAPEGN